VSEDGIKVIRACPVAPADGTGVTPADGTGVICEICGLNTAHFVVF
jgi:hypothetical protein